MDSKDNIPLLFSQGLEGLVAQDAGVGNENMDASKLLQSDLHDLLGVFSRANSSSSFASG